MRQFTVTTEGQNRLGLREFCQQFVDEQWVAVHLPADQAAESVLREFKRAARGPSRATRTPAFRTLNRRPVA